jgi:heat shock protein HslJ
MYADTAGTVVFTDCASGVRYAVAPHGEARAALDRAYVEARSQPGAEVLAEIEGSIARRPDESGGEHEVIVISKFLNVTPGATCAGGDVLGAGEATGGPTPTSVEGVDWVLERVADKTIDPAAPKKPSLRLDTAEKKMSGFAGCNRMFGSYELDGTSLHFGSVGATRMMCPDAMEIENAFMAALSATRSYMLKDGALALADSSGTTIAVLRPGAPEETSEAK